MSYVTNMLENLAAQTAFVNMSWGNILMIFIALVFLYLAIAKGYEPLLLVPISFGMLLVNIYPDIMKEGGLLTVWYLWCLLLCYITWIQR